MPHVFFPCHVLGARANVKSGPCFLSLFCKLAFGRVRIMPPFIFDRGFVFFLFFFFGNMSALSARNRITDEKARMKKTGMRILTARVMDCRIRS